MSASPVFPFIRGLGDIIDGYAAVLCDLWGVLHDGRHAFPEALAALRRARAAGRLVVLLTNVPRPGRLIVDDFRRFGIPADICDGVITSGDVSRSLLRQSGAHAVLHIGKARNLSLFEGIDVALVDDAAAEIIVCTSLADEEHETPALYRDRLERLAARGLTLFCANPDRVAQRGSGFVYCAGALADLYAELGGTVVISGKPNPPIYDAAMTELARLAGRPLARSEVLAIGDGLPTDIAGAVRNGFDALMVTSGIHADEFGAPDRPDPQRLTDRLAADDLTIRAAISHLRW